MTEPANGDALSRDVGDAAVVRTAFEQMPVMLVSLAGPDCRIEAVNAAFREFTGRSALIGMPLREALPDIAGQHIFETLDRVYATGTPMTGQEWRLQVERESGAVVELYVDFSVMPVRSGDGTVTGLAGAGIDVTERVRQRLAAERHADDAEQRYLDAREVVSGLQRAMLPAALPALPKARISARYLVAGQDNAAGGDWFDAIPLAGGAVALMVGDVVGHGVLASTAMARMTAVLSELLTAEDDLAVVLARADAYAARLPELRTATLAIALLDPSTGSLRYATCGHPPPLLVRRDGTARYLPGTGGAPLGTGSAPVLADDRLQPGELLLLYSDGLIDRPGRTLAEGMSELAAVAADAAANRAYPVGAPDAASERVCRLAIELLTRTGYADDVTALVAELLPSPVPAVRLRVPSEVASLTEVRGALQEWLSAVDPLPDDRDAVHMAVVEIVTNAIEHAYPAGQPGPIDFALALRSDGRMECQITDYGSWRTQERPAAERGNGLMVARHMVDELRISHPAGAVGSVPDAAGTVVTLLHRMRRPAVLGAEASAEAAAFPASPAFGLDREIDGRAANARVRGPVDVTTADQFLRMLLSACRGGTLPLSVDLTDVTHLASAGVRALFELARQLKVHDLALTLVARQGSPAQAVLTLVRLRHTAP